MQIMTLLDAESEPTDKDMELMDDIKAELDEWGAQFDSEFLTKQ